MLTLSIVIPVYNEEYHLRACLDAIAKQTVKPKQVIVVDNNSTDKSAEIAKSYKFVTILKEKKQGIGYARDRGFNAVTADVIGRIDADSVIEPNWVEYASTYLGIFPDELLTGGCYIYDLSMPRFFGWIQSQIAFRANRFVMGHYIAWGANMAFRRELWHQVKTKVHNFPDIHEDMDLSIHLHEIGYKIAYHTDWKVGVASRVENRHARHTQMKWLKMWPRTFRFHNLPRAWLGDIGVYLVYYSWWPAKLLNGLANLFSSTTARRLK